MQSKTLNELKVGQAGLIAKLEASGAARHRLMEMGMIRGERIEVMRMAPLGDPVEYQVKGYRLSLRKDEARQIVVEVEND